MQPSPGAAGPTGTARLTRRAMLVGLVAGSAAAGVGAASLGAGRSPSSAGAAEADVPNEADIGFCRDMSVHHVQALALCQRVLGRDTGGSVQAAGVEVLQNQAMEVGQMRAWLADWGESTSPPELVMAWMATAADEDNPHAGHGEGVPLADMPGYATPAELQELSKLEGRAQGRRWLELMRAHHVGGVAMASAASELAQLDKVRRLATAQAEVQTFEISQYDLLLAGEYADF
jgi:uncharacterized protein (DUF305 family)